MLSKNKLEKIILEEVDYLTECIRITDKKMCGYKKMFEVGIEYYNACDILDRIKTLESQKEEYILKHSTLVKIINEYRGED